VNAALVAVLLARVWELAEDVGRLGRRIDPDSSASFSVDRIASHVHAIDRMLRPTAAELVAWSAPGDDEAVDEALRIVDEQYRRLRQRMGGRP
jgi:hypothetical protein